MLTGAYSFLLPFLLRDETGVCIIDPEGAEVSADLKKAWHGSTRRPPGAAAPVRGNRPSGGLLDGLKMRSGISLNMGPGLDLSMDLGSGYRYSEEWIPEGSPLYAIGLFRSLDDGDHQQSRQAIMRELLRPWKQDAKGLLAREHGHPHAGPHRLPAPAVPARDHGPEPSGPALPDLRCGVRRPVLRHWRHRRLSVRGPVSDVRNL